MNRWARRAGTLLVTGSLALAPVAGVPALAAGPSDYADTIADAKAALAETLAGSGATSISVALTDDSQVIWSGTAGVREAGGPQPTTRTRYGIGSVSKTLTALAVMQLADAGSVELDAPVTRYLPEFTMASPGYRQITVRMLLNHSAGLPGMTPQGLFTTTAYRDYAAHVLRSLRTQRLKTTPGTMSVYCNDCFTLAGIVVERVSGERFTRYVRRHIMAPLGMTRSGYVTTNAADGDRARVVADGRTQPAEITNAQATGGVQSTPADMARLARMMLNGGTLDGRRIVSEQALAEMGQEQGTHEALPVERSDVAYGLGWDSVADGAFAGIGPGGTDVTAWAKGGDTADYHAQFVVLPDADLAITITGAGRTFDSGIAAALGQRILLHALVEQGDLPALPAPVSTTTPDSATPTPDQVARLTGIFMNSSGGYRVRHTGGSGFRVQRLDHGAWTPLQTATFRADGRLWPDVAGQAPGIMWTARAWHRDYLMWAAPAGFGHYRSTMPIGQRVRPGAALTSAWRARLGAWLPVSDVPSSTAWRATGGSLERIPGLPGFVNVAGLIVDAGAGPGVARMFLQIPVATGRDQGDLVAVRHGGEQWLRLGDLVLRPAASVPVLRRGPQQVRIAATGYAQWQRVPAAGRVRIVGADAFRVYDRDLVLQRFSTRSRATVTAAQGSWLLLFGDPGDTIRLHRR